MKITLETYNNELDGVFKYYLEKLLNKLVDEHRMFVTVTEHGPVSQRQRNEAQTFVDAGSNPAGSTRKEM